MEELGAISPGASADDLQHIALDYNWDDGFDFPLAIADHPHCDLAVALELFWLADGISVYLRSDTASEFNKDWHKFSELLIERILNGYYTQGSASFRIPLSKVQVFKYRKQGVPEVFLNSIGAP